MNLALIAALIATFHVPYALDSFDETKPVEMAALDEPAIEQIRLEIRRLLPATWTIAADGNIKTMKIEGVTDRQLTLRLTQADPTSRLAPQRGRGRGEAAGAGAGREGPEVPAGLRGSHAERGGEGRQFSRRGPLTRRAPPVGLSPASRGRGVK